VVGATGSVGSAGGHRLVLIAEANIRWSWVVVAGVLESWKKDQYNPEGPLERELGGTQREPVMCQADFLVLPR
jgi:hypothetical protein